MTQFQNPFDPMQNAQDPAMQGQDQAAQNVDITQQSPSGAENKQDETSWWDTADVLAAVPRGAVNAVKGLYNTADWLTMDTLPDWETNPLGESRSIAGGLVTGLVEFGLAMIPGGAAMNAVGGLAKAGRLGETAGSALSWMVKAQKGEKMSFARSVGQMAVKNATGGFILGTPGQQRLSNLAIQFDSPLLNNDITQYLAGNADDTMLESKLKNAIENTFVGAAVDTVLAGVMGSVRAVRTGMQRSREVLESGGSEASALEAAVKAESAAAKEVEPAIKAASAEVERAASAEVAGRSFAKVGDTGVNGAGEGMTVSMEPKAPVDFAASKPLMTRAKSLLADAESKVPKGSAILEAEDQKVIEVALESAKRHAKFAAEGDPSFAEYLEEEVVASLGDKYGHSWKDLPDVVRKTVNSLTENSNGVSAAGIEGELYAAAKAANERVAALRGIVDGTKMPSTVQELDALGLGNEARRAWFSAGGRARVNGVEIGGSARTTLEGLLKTQGLTRAQKAVAQFMLKVAGKQLDEVPLFGTPDSKQAASKIAGVYSPIEHSIDINTLHRMSPSDQAKTIIHEAAHSITVNKINEAVERAVGALDLAGLSVRNPGAKATAAMEWASMSGASLMEQSNKLQQFIPKIKDKNVKNLLTVYKAVIDNAPGGSLATRAGENAPVYGFTNVMEMVSEAFSNPEFQAHLASIQIDDTNLWKRLVDTVSKFLGIENLTDTILKDKAFGATIGSQLADTEGVSALEQIMREGGELMSKGEPGVGVGARAPKSFANVLDHPGDTGTPGPNAQLGARQTNKEGVVTPTAPSRPFNEITAEMADIIRRGRTAGGYSAADQVKIDSLIEETTKAGLENVGFAKDKARTETLIALSDAITQNKSFYEEALRTRTNAASAYARDQFLSAVEALGGMNAEQKSRFAATITNWHGAMFEDGALIVMGMANNAVKDYAQAIASGASQGERDVLLAGMMNLGAANRKIGEIAGRMLQNRKMFLDEAFAVRIKSMSPQEVASRTEALKDLLEIGMIDKETFFRCRDSGFTNAGTVGCGTWLFKNSILSGTTTSAVNAISGIASHLYMPAERALGELALTAVGKSSMENVYRELRVYRGYMHAITDAWNGLTGFGVSTEANAGRAIKNSWKNEGDSVTLGASQSPYGEFVSRRPISSENPNLAGPLGKVGLPTYRFDPATNTNQRTMMGAALDWFGKVAGTPLRVMGTIDETLSSVYARSEAKVLLAENAPAHIKSDPRLLAQFVEGKMKECFDETGALFSEDAIRAQVMREAKAQGFSPGSAEWQAYVQNNMAQRWNAPTDGVRENNAFLQKIADKVRSRTEYGTMKRDFDTITENNSFGPAVVGNLGKAASGLVNHLPAAGLILPFVKTPTNLAAWALERTPTSAARNLLKQWNNPEMAGEVAGRLCAGAMFYGTMMSLAMSGSITGRGPSDPNVRKALVDSGWQPYSMRFGDRWISYARLDPFATIFGMVADMVEISTTKYTDKEFLNTSDMLAKTAIGTISNNLVNKTYLAGLKGALDAIGSWETKGPQFLRQYAGSLVPNILAQSNLIMDDDLNAPRSAIDAIRARIPGLDHAVDKSRNALGEPLENTTQWWNSAIPTKVSTESRDTVKKELADLLVGFAPPAPQLDGNVNLTEYRSASGQSAYDRYQELTSQVSLGGNTIKDRLAQLIGSETYQRMPASSVDGLQTTRVGMLRSEISRYRREALRQLQEEFPDLARRRSDVTNLKQQMIRGM